MSKNDICIIYSIIVPVYKGARNLANLLERLTKQLDKLSKSYEIIMVEDCGGDDSWEVLCSLQPEYPQMKIVRLMRNFGQHNAIMCGFSLCSGEYVITLDDDLQHPPEEIPKLLAEIEKGYDVVYGVPMQRQHHPLRNLGSRVVRNVYKRIFHSSVELTPFRIIRRPVVECVVGYNKNFTFIDGLLAWYTDRIGQVTVHHEKRTEGKTGYSLARLISLALNMVTNFSIVPLQIVSFLGLIFSLFGFSLAVGYLVKYFIWGIPVPGYTSIIIAVTLFSGVQMLSLGLIGEYLGRVHLNINTKPQYQVRESRGFPNRHAPKTDRD